MICFLDLYLEGEPVCSPGSFEGGPVDGVVAGSPLAVCVYLRRFWMSVLVHWVGWKVLFGVLYYMNVDMAAP